jgi:hypothetical protein
MNTTVSWFVTVCGMKRAGVSGGDNASIFGSTSKPREKPAEAGGKLTHILKINLSLCPLNVFTGTQQIVSIFPDVKFFRLWSSEL